MRSAFSRWRNLLANLASSRAKRLKRIKRYHAGRRLRLDGLGFPRFFNVPGVRDPGDIVDIGAYEIGVARVVDVVLDNLNWAAGVEYSYAEVVMAGNQFRPEWH